MGNPIERKSKKKIYTHLYPLTLSLKDKTKAICNRLVYYV